MLENKLGITDSTELARMEEKISKQKALEMFESGFFETLEPGTYKSLAMIHQYLFDEIYDFAGKLRKVNISKGNFRFAPLMYLETALQSIDKMPQSTFDDIIEKYDREILKMLYYRGLKEWDNEKGYLTDTCLTAQDKYKAYLDYFRIGY